MTEQQYKYTPPKPNMPDLSQVSTEDAHQAIGILNQAITAKYQEVKQVQANTGPAADAKLIAANAAFGGVIGLVGAGIHSLIKRKAIGLKGFGAYIGGFALGSGVLQAMFNASGKASGYLPHITDQLQEMNATRNILAAAHQAHFTSPPAAEEQYQSIKNDPLFHQPSKLEQLQQSFADRNPKRDPLVPDGNSQQRG